MNIPVVPGTTNALPQDCEQPIHVTKLQQKPQQQLKTKIDSSELAPVNFVTQIAQELPEAGFISIQNPANNLKRRLWKARINPLIENADKDNTSKNELQLIIKQIRSITFEPKSKPQPIISVEPTPKTEPNETSSDTETPKENEKKQVQYQIPYEPLTSQTLETLRNLSQHPDKLNNPFELAEVLFLSGHLKEAVLLYQEALNRTSSDDVDSAQDRAWILFQIANCLQDDDPPTAVKMYRQLITEYPDSPWTDLAKARDKIIDWYTKENPQTLITDLILTEPQE
ncbi:MAG: tetratricopeptide repeat protein [Planctomycetota bacterium]